MIGADNVEQYGVGIFPRYRCPERQGELYFSAYSCVLRPNLYMPNQSVRFCQIGLKFRSHRRATRRGATIVRTGEATTKGRLVAVVPGVPRARLCAHTPGQVAVPRAGPEAVSLRGGWFARFGRLGPGHSGGLFAQSLLDASKQDLLS